MVEHVCTYIGRKIKNLKSKVCIVVGLQLIQGLETDYQNLNWFQSYDRKRKNLKKHYTRDFSSQNYKKPETFAFCVITFESIKI